MNDLGINNLFDRINKEEIGNVAFFDELEQNFNRLIELAPDKFKLIELGKKEIIQFKENLDILGYNKYYPSTVPYLDLKDFFKNGWNLGLKGIHNVPENLLESIKNSVERYSKDIEYRLYLIKSIRNIVEIGIACAKYDCFLANQKKLLREKTKINSEEETPLINAKSIGQKYMLLNELGIYDHLRQKYNLSNEKIAELFEVITGHKKRSIASIISECKTQKNNDPYKNDRNNLWLQTQLTSLKIKRE